MLKTLSHGFQIIKYGFEYHIYINPNHIKKQALFIFCYNIFIFPKKTLRFQRKSPPRPGNLSIHRIRANITIL